SLSHPHLPSFPTRRSSDLTCFGPTAKFLTIISHHHNTFSVECCKGTQGLNRFAYRTPGNGIAHLFTGGIYLKDTALILSGVVSRSEEHTSELQSLAYLVCR